MLKKQRIVSVLTAALVLLPVLSLDHADAHNRKRKRRAPVKIVRHHENIWEDLEHCESGHTSARGKYRGYFQFSYRTWASMPGRSGDPANHTYQEQLDTAIALQARSGWGQWPSCARRLGLI